MLEDNAERNCEVIETGTEVTRSHNGRAFVVINPRYREIGVIQVDGCLINDGSKRIDWMVRLPTNKRLRDGTETLKLIELKGSNILHAFTQMRETVLHAAVRPCRTLISEGFIVSQLNPALLSQSQIESVKFLTEFDIIIRVVKLAEINATP